MQWQPAFVATIICFTAGCATSPYLQDRGRDAADIFSVTAGYGVGIRAQVGPLATSVGMIKDVGGVMSGTGLWATDAMPGSLGFLYLEGTSGNNHKDIAVLRKKSYEEAHMALLPFMYGVPSFPYFNPDEYHYLTKIEAAAGLGPSLRVAFNPVELVDFVLGFFNVDLFGDDINAYFEPRNRAERILLDPSLFPDESIRRKSLKLVRDDRPGRKYVPFDSDPRPDMAAIIARHGPPDRVGRYPFDPTQGECIYDQVGFRPSVGQVNAIRMVPVDRD